MKKLWILSLLFAACQPQEAKDQLVIEPVAEGQSFNAAFLMIDGVYNSELMAPFDIF